LIVQSCSVMKSLAQGLHHTLIDFAPPQGDNPVTQVGAPQVLP